MPSAWSSVISSSLEAYRRIRPIIQLRLQPILHSQASLNPKRSLQTRWRINDLIFRSECSVRSWWLVLSGDGACAVAFLCFKLWRKIRYAFRANLKERKHREPRCHSLQKRSPRRELFATFSNLIPTSPLKIGSPTVSAIVGS